MAHIPDGVLSVPVLAAGAAVTLAGCAWGLRRLEAERIPQTAVLAAVFFVAALVHFPVGPASVHLILNGLTGIALGPAAFPAILVALLLQALLFGFGGLVTLGVNVAVMALPALLCGLGFGWLHRRGGGRWSVAAAALAGALGVLGTALLVALALAASGREFLPAARLVVLAHLPVMLIEGFFTAAAVGLVLRVRPETLAPLLLAALLPLVATPALAHKLKLFATAEGPVVSGYAYFTSGTRAQDAAISAETAQGEPLFSGRTDDAGGFRFETRSAGPLILTVDGGDGHQARLTLGDTAPPPTTTADATISEISAADLQALIETSVARQLRPLLEQLDAERDAVRGRDVVGGLGWIIGLGGLAYGMALHRRRPAPTPPPAGTEGTRT